MITIVSCCIQKATSVFLQALGRPVLSLSLSLLRDFVISVPAVLLLPRYLGVTGTLWSAPVADILSMIAVLLMMRVAWSDLSENAEELKGREKKIVAN